MTHQDTVSEYLQQAETLKKKGDFEKSIQALHKLITAEPNCSEAYEELGDNYLSLRELDKAEKALLEGLKINPRSANGRYLLGFLYSVQQRWDSSVEQLIRANEFMPNHAEILRCLGWSMYNHTRKAQGLSVLERSLNLAPSDQNILCDLGVCYMNAGDFDRAEKTFKQVIEINPDSDQAVECCQFLKMIQTRHLV
ncbi:tetratricopeptide repeat protein [Candidatus Gracilibacteria bacterium]|nr:tetratricopeptide repeat protein [Candidatus Gracilibacteria bacterium]MCF7819459.1 tetratricopeptide repeat protein [Candidatus Gracilibacteria bacterium]